MKFFHEQLALYLLFSDTGVAAYPFRLSANPIQCPPNIPLLCKEGLGEVETANSPLMERLQDNTRQNKFPLRKMGKGVYDPDFPLQPTSTATW